MKRITYWALSTITAVVLLFGYHTSTAGPRATSSPTSVRAPISDSSSSGTSESTAPDGSEGSSDDTSTSSTVTGGVVQTQWGPVQVELSIAADEITDVSVVQYPNENGRDVEINNYALPILIQETIDAQSADIDMVCSTARLGSPAWYVGIEDPADPAEIVAVVPMRNGAVATSGLVHRGPHIADPRTGATPRAFSPVTLVAPSLTEADVDATAAFVLGDAAPEWLAGRHGRAALLVRLEGSTESIGFQAQLN